MSAEADSWIKFVRRYGPIPRADNMYDETIQRAARRTGIKPIFFVHPKRGDVCASFDPLVGALKSVILTGEAGDGKTHLCREAWESLMGDPEEWETDETYLCTSIKTASGDFVPLHVIRDLSAWVPQRDAEWPEEKAALLEAFSNSLFGSDAREYFLIAANDGQLIETWRRLPDSVAVCKARELFATLLCEDRAEEPGIPLYFLNLSRGSSADLLDQAIKAFLEHKGWKECLRSAEVDSYLAFGSQSPIRRNFELLETELVQQRLRALFQLCDYNGLHIPIRQILLLLSNIVLGNPDCKDNLMVPADISQIINSRSSARASIYNNIFGGNLSDNHRESIPVFSHLDRFRIGFETTNRIDNLLIFGEANANLRPYFDQLLGSDTFYGADDNYRQAQWDYIEGADEDETRMTEFLAQLIAQRRALFFKIPVEQEEELRLWELTVFTFAGEYLTRVVQILRFGAKVERSILARLVRGLNRIFVGMLIATDRELFLATSLAFSNAKVSRMLEERVSVSPRLGEKVEIIIDNGIPALNVVLSPARNCVFRLNLTRFEFLSRVACGALPNSFSKECYEDALSFKAQLLAALEERRRDEPPEFDASVLSFRLLDLDDAGNPTEEPVEVSTDD